MNICYWCKNGDDVDRTKRALLGGGSSFAHSLTHLLIHTQTFSLSNFLNLAGFGTRTLTHTHSPSGNTLIYTYQGTWSRFAKIISTFSHRGERRTNFSVLFSMLSAVRSQQYERDGRRRARIFIFRACLSWETKATCNRKCNRINHTDPSYRRVAPPHFRARSGGRKSTKYCHRRGTHCPSRMCAKFFARDANRIGTSPFRHRQRIWCFETLTA